MRERGGKSQNYAKEVAAGIRSTRTTILNGPEAIIRNQHTNPAPRPSSYERAPGGPWGLRRIGIAINEWRKGDNEYRVAKDGTLNQVRDTHFRTRRGLGKKFERRGKPFLAKARKFRLGQIKLFTNIFQPVASSRAFRALRWLFHTRMTAAQDSDASLE